MNTNTTTTAPSTYKFGPGQLVARTSTSPNAEILPPQVLIDDCAGDTTLTDQGWQYAEFPGTGFRVLVRLTGQERHLAKWSTWMALVEVADVETGVRFIGDDNFSIVTELGEVRKGRKWMVRVDRLAGA